MKVRYALSILVVLAGASLSHVSLAAAAEPPAVAAAPEFNEEEKALMKALDTELVRFEAIIAKIDDANYAKFLKEQLQKYRSRRDAFRTFDQGKYDELRYDINVDHQRAAQWLLPSVPPRPAKKS